MRRSLHVQFGYFLRQGLLAAEDRAQDRDLDVLVLFLLVGLDGDDDNLVFPDIEGFELQVYYSTEKGIEALRSLILNLGSPLIGAAAIVTSLVMFAMQINVERMPHGLFRRLSADPKLLGAFGAAFLLAIGVAVLSVITEKSRLAVVVLAAGWGRPSSNSSNN